MIDNKWKEGDECRLSVFFPGKHEWLYCSYPLRERVDGKSRVCAHETEIWKIQQQAGTSKQQPYLQIM